MTLAEGVTPLPRLKQVSQEGAPTKLMIISDSVGVYFDVMDSALVFTAEQIGEQSMKRA